MVVHLTYLCIGPVMYWKWIQDFVYLYCVGCWNWHQISYSPNGGGTENMFMECNHYMV